MYIKEQSGRGTLRHVTVPRSAKADEAVLTFMAEITLLPGGLITAGHLSICISASGQATSKEIP